MNHIKKQEADLNIKMEKLIAERDCHVRRKRRINNEDTSRYLNFYSLLSGTKNLIEADKRTILKDRYLVLSLIGKGGFSEVYKVFDLVEYEHRACKIHCINENWTTAQKNSYLTHALRETRIHKNLRHPGIVELYDVFEIDTQSFASVMEVSLYVTVVL